MLSEPQGKVGLIILVLVVIGVGYMLWKRSAPPAPTVPAGQTLQSPLGSAGAMPGRNRRGLPFPR